MNVVSFSTQLNLIRLSLTLSLCFSPWPVMHRLSFLCFVTLFIFLLSSVLFLYSSPSLILLVHCIYIFWCVCVCHSVKTLLTCGLLCFPYGNCSFILALAADGMNVSGKGDRWRSALKSNFMTLKATPSVFSSALCLDIGQQREWRLRHTEVCVNVCSVNGQKVMCVSTGRHDKEFVQVNSWRALTNAWESGQGGKNTIKVYPKRLRAFHTILHCQKKLQKW